MKKFIRSTIRSIRIRVFHAIGMLSHNRRMIPDFLIIGAQKGGTSSLFYYLKFHPQIKRPIKKEIHFFNIYFDKGIDWYKAHFPLKSKKYITGEASPDYIFHPDSPKRIKKLNPNTKIIVLLRNPIERAYSAYQMNKRMGIDPRPTFKEAIKYELEHKDEFAHTYNYEKHNYFYLERGKYASQLNPWLDYFDKDHILVIESESFFKEPSKELKKVYQFLSIESSLPSHYKAMNVGKYPPLSKEVYKSLKDYFKNDISLLKETWNVEFLI